jgi:L-lactate dehydrogenase complex protein LldG
MNRDEFMTCVREAAASGLRYRVHVRRDLTYADGRADDVPADVVERYVAEATKIGGRVTRCETWDAARDAVEHFLRTNEPNTALCWRHPTLDRLQLAELLEAHGVELVDAMSLAGLSREAQRHKMLSTDVGITSTTWAVAETGSLFNMHGPGNERVTSLLPPVYLAVIERSQIVADLFDVFDCVNEQTVANEKLPSNATFISGPSKTGDIEMQLVTGVHGPGKWHVVVVG